MWKVIAFVSIVTGAPNNLVNINLNPINQFSLTLLNNAYAYQENLGDKNIALSPLSVWSVFALLAEGSAGETFTELVRELRLAEDLKETQLLHSTISTLLRIKDNDVTLNSKSAMYSDRNLKIYQEFCQSALYYGADVFSVDTTNTTRLADDINYYVCIATEGRIRTAVRPELLDDLKLILIDALYFKASWTNPFDPTQTKQEAFYDSQGKPIGTVNMMYHKAPHNFGDSNSIGAQILEMTYGQNERYSMLILLPFDGMSLKTLLKNLANQPLDWMSDYKTSDDLNEIDCYIPRFKISSQVDLIRPMQYSGIQQIFDREKAQLPGVSDSPLFVSKTVQNVELEVTEEGTVVAASTIVGLEDRFLGPRFEANKEFVFLIQERSTRLIILSGVYAEPSVV